MGKRDAAFEYAGQWLDKEHPDGPWYRYWLEGRRVRRRSTGERNLDRARDALIAEAMTQPKTAGEPTDIAMAAVFRHYLDTSFIPRRENPDVPSRTEKEIRRHLRRVGAFMTARSPNKDAYSVAEFDLLQQRAFARQLHGECLKPKSISTLMSCVGAALKYAAKDKVVDTASGERVVRLLKYAPTVMTNETEIAKLVGGEVSRPRQFVPTIGEFADVLDAIEHEHLFRFFMIALTTWARPTAVLEFDVEEQVDFRYGVVDLLKTGKLQTKKRRPIIPLCPTLRDWLTHWDARHPVIWNGGPIREINDAFRSIVRPLGLGEFTPYTIRHFCSSEAIARGANDADRSRMLGHLPKAAAATSAWYEHGTVANYLKSAVDATESLIDDLQGLCGRPLRAPKVLPKQHLRAI